MQVQFSTMGIESLAKTKQTHALKRLPPIASDSQKYGCGLAYLANRIDEHYKNENKRYNRLPVRLIGAQAIALARFGYRLADCLQYPQETDGQKLKRIALSKSVQFLRNAGGLFNKIHISISELSELEEFCELYFNLCFFLTLLISLCGQLGMPYHTMQGSVIMNIKSGLGYCLFKQRNQSMLVLRWN